jgi:hypothetical protein
MSTHRRTWQKAESRAAAIFGARRAVLSGSSGRDDTSCSDSTHPTLFVESKLRETHSVRTLHDATRKLATKEGKTPVLCLFDKGRPGFLLVIHSDDLRAVFEAWQAARAEEAVSGEQPEVEADGGFRLSGE